MSKSNFFHVTNGVKQGGVLSPVLFTSYMDKLLEELQSSGVGCYVGTKFMGAFGYADDGAVLAPTVTSLKIMLNICDEFGKQYDVLFNPDKYQLLFYSNNDKTLHGIWYNNVFIETTDCGIHLGHPIGAKGNFWAISDGINKFLIYFNTMSLFAKAHTNVKYTLFQSYCMSCYGCVLWDFSSNDMQ